jgi:hypothetical protein
MPMLRQLKVLLAIGAVAALLAGCGGGGGGEPGNGGGADRQGQDTPGLERPQTVGNEATEPGNDAMEATQP